MQFFGTEDIKDLTKASQTTIEWASGSNLRIGGQAYNVTSVLTLDTATDIDTGVITNDTIYYVYAVVVAGTVSLKYSLSNSAPTGYSAYRLIGSFYTDGSAEISEVGKLDSNGIFFLDKNPTITKLLANFSPGTYVTPIGVKYIKIRMVGGGGGGSGGGLDGGAAGGTGGATTFGSSLLTANGGAPGTGTNPDGGSGGTSTINLPAYGIAQKGNGGISVVNRPLNTTNASAGGTGGASPFGGVGKSGMLQTGEAPEANSGSGGTGGAGAAAGNHNGGAGGGSGGYIEARIDSPDSSYSYTVGTGGSGGSGDNGGYSGSAGASGVIIIEEYYK